MTTDWVKYFKNMFYCWDETLSMGMADYRQVALLIPYALVGAFFQSLGFSLVFVEKFFFYFWFAGSGLSMYFLCSVLEMKRAGKLVSSIFYMLNPFSLIIIWIVSHGLIQMPYAFAPLVLGLYIYGLKKKKGAPYIIFANFVWLFSTGSANANPRMTIVHWLPIAFYFVISFIFNKGERKFIFKYTSEFLGFWLLLNFYWLFVFIRTAGQSVASAHSPFLLPDEPQLRLTSVKFFEAIRMLGYWSLKSGFSGDPYYPYWNFFNSFWIILISWLVPVFVALGLINKEVKKSRLKFFFAVMLIFGLIGINGANPPIGNAIVWFYKLFPPLMLLARFNFLFFGMPTYLIFCLLFGYGFLFLYEFTARKLNKKFIIAASFFLMVLLSVILVFPFWNGEVIRTSGKFLPGERYKIPQYWYEASKYLSSQKDFFRVLPLPMSTTYNMVVKWGEGYAGGDLTRWFMPQPVINANTGETYKIPELIGKSIEQETDFTNISNLLGFLNVKYLIVRNDTRWEFLRGNDWWYNHDPQNTEKFVKNQKGLFFEKRFGELDIYRLSDELILPKIYVPAKITMINGGAEEIEAISQFLHPETKEGFILSEQNKDADFILEPAEASLINNEQKEEVNSEIQVESGGKFRILFSDNGFFNYYKEGVPWKIKIDEKPFEAKNALPFRNNLISLGEVELPAGRHQLSFVLPPSLNLASGFWATPEGALSYSDDAPESGMGSLRLSVKQGAGLLSIPISFFRRGEAYAIQFSAKNLAGSLPFILLWENLENSSEPSFNPILSQFGYTNLKTTYDRINLSAGSSWQRDNLTFKPEQFAITAGITFVSDAGEAEEFQKPADNLFSQIKIYNIFSKPLILQRLVSQTDQVEASPPKISFKKISPVKYEVEVEQATKPFYLFFSEAFHSGWTISTAAKHLTVNGYANGWLIDKAGSYKINIYFKPQNLLILGFGVSGVCFICALVYLIAYYFSKRHI